MTGRTNDGRAAARPDVHRADGAEADRGGSGGGQSAVADTPDLPEQRSANEPWPTGRRRPRADPEPDGPPGTPQRVWEAVRAVLPRPTTPPTTGVSLVKRVEQARPPLLARFEQFARVALLEPDARLDEPVVEPPPPPPPPPAPTVAVADLYAPRPRVVDDGGLFGLTRYSRGKVGSRLFTLAFTLVYLVILIQLGYALLHG